MFLSNVNTKRLGMLAVAIIVYQMASDFLLHQVLLKSMYAETPTLWRPEAEIGSMMGWMLLGQILIATFFALIFVKGYEGKGIGEGIRFGLLAGIFLNAPVFIQYAVSPMPSNLVCAWFCAGVAQAVGGGIVASLVYRR